MKAGIICDDYKLPKFKERLDAEKFVYTVEPYQKDVSVIFVLTAAEKIPTVKNICDELEIHFLNNKAKNN
jgi:hypothetical protein